MNKKLTVAVLGCGNRGVAYTQLIVHSSDYEIVALCDRQPKQIDRILKLCGIKNALTFTDADLFLERKYADVLVIASDDRFHVPQCVKALELGYDVLLEKPISDNREEIKTLIKTQHRTGRKVIVCHVLRYGYGFKTCGKLLKTNAIGSLYAINATERIAYWHWVQAYVRGIGASLKDGHPAILAKCCHDLDLIQSYAKSKCETVSSIGSLRFFKKENAPEGAAKKCVDCKYIDTCTYSAKRIYVDEWKKTKPEYAWPFSKVTTQNPLTEEALLEGLKDGVYGQCAFQCKVDKVDHQLVQMQFKNGVCASLTMAYAAEPGRRIVFYGTLGEITLDERVGNIELKVYGGETQKFPLIDPLLGGIGHGGGDEGLIKDLYNILTGKIPCTTTLAESLESHLIGIAAEESRLNGGKLVKVH